MRDGMRVWVAAGIGLWLGFAPAAAFDLRDWTRKPIPNSPTVFYECTTPPACGAGSAVSGRMHPLPPNPVGIEDERQRQQGIARRMREQMADRIVEVDVDQTRERPIEGLRAFVTAKVVIFADGRRQAYIDSMLFGPTRAYSIVASGGDPEVVRRNFEGYAKTLALVLDQLAAADATRSAPQPGPPPQQPQLSPRPPRPAPPPRPQPPTAQKNPPAGPQPNYRPGPNPQEPYHEPPDYQPAPGNFPPPPSQGFPPQPPPANFPPPPAPPR